MWIIRTHVSSGIQFHVGCFIPGAGSCAQKYISDGFQIAEQNQRVWLEETHIQNKCASHSPMAIFLSSPPFGMCVCERGLVGGKFPVIPFIQLGLRTCIYLPLKLQTQHNLKLSLTPNWGHLMSGGNAEQKQRFWHVSLPELPLHRILGGVSEQLRPGVSPSAARWAGNKLLDGNLVYSV